jgi:hypothetical protein
MQSKLAMITFMDGGGGSIDNTPPGAPVYPSGGPVLPPGGALLPVYPFDPTTPDNTLPGGGYPTPGPIVPGKKFIVKYLACTGLILVPDNTLPPTPEPK